MEEFQLENLSMLSNIDVISINTYCVWSILLGLRDW